MMGSVHLFEMADVQLCEILAVSMRRQLCSCMRLELYIFFSDGSCAVV